MLYLFMFDFGELMLFGMFELLWLDLRFLLVWLFLVMLWGGMVLYIFGGVGIRWEVEVIIYDDLFFMLWLLRIVLLFFIIVFVKLGFN